MKKLKRLLFLLLFIPVLLSGQNVLTDGTNVLRVGSVVLTQDYPGQIVDGNTVAWYIADELSTITKDGGDLVSDWEDFLGSGNDLEQGTGADQPLWSSSGILFDGTSDFMKDAFTYVQPEMIYMVCKQVTWTLNDRLFDGVTSFRGLLHQSALTPELKAFAGNLSGAISPTLDTYFIVRVLFNGASSELILNNGIPVTGNWGAADLDGFTLGANGLGNAEWGHIEVKEIILRNVADDSVTQQVIYDYLKSKYGLSPNGLIFMFMLMLYIGNRKRFNEKKSHI